MANLQYQPFKKPINKGFFACRFVAIFKNKSGQLARKSGQMTDFSKISTLTISYKNVKTHFKSGQWPDLKIKVATKQKEKGLV